MKLFCGHCTSKVSEWKITFLYLDIFNKSSRNEKKTKNILLNMCDEGVNEFMIK